MFFVFSGIRWGFFISRTVSLPEGIVFLEKITWFKKRQEQNSGFTKFHPGSPVILVNPGRLTWNLRIHPWKRKIIWTKPSFSGSLVGAFNPLEKYDRQIGNLPQQGVKIRNNIWNHHLVNLWGCTPPSLGYTLANYDPSVSSWHLRAHSAMEAKCHPGILLGSWRNKKNTFSMSRLYKKKMYIHIYEK